MTGFLSRIVPLTLLLPVAACSCGEDNPADRCVTTADCVAGDLCIDGTCRTPPDGGGLDAGARRDGSAMDAGGAACRTDDDCGGGVCLDGACCPSADDVCGTSCCGDGETCFANACVTPGRDCRTDDDCDEGQYCEPGLGGDPGGADGGVPDAGMTCLGEAPRTGRCVDLPPRCEDIGGTPGEDVCITECEYHPPVEMLRATQQWHWGSEAVEYPNEIDVWSTPTVGRVTDTNCDGTVDILDPPNVVFVSGDSGGVHCSHTMHSPSACRTGVLRVLDGRTGREVWSLDQAEPGSLGFAGMSVALGDVTGDERVEIVATTGEGKVVVVDGEGRVLMVSSETIPDDGERPFGWGGGLALADMNGDGAVEIAYARTVFTVEGGTLSTLFVGSLGRGGRRQSDALSTFADLDADEDLELVAGRTAYEIDGNPLWNRADISDGFPAVGDLDGDGTPEVVLVHGGDVTILAGEDGSTELGPFTLPGTGFGGPPTIADFDGDGAPEIGVAKAQFYSVVEPDYGAGTIELVWNTANHDLSSSVTGSTVFDFEGDGIAEVIYNDECFLWVYDGPTGAVRFATPTTSFTATEASLVADIDGDGHAEMLMVANGADPSSSGWGCDVAPWNADDPTTGRPAWEPPAGETAHRGVWAWRATDNSWVGTRPLWNQHTYHVTNVCSPNDDACDPALHYGAIPERERRNWSVGWLDNFRQNVQGEGIFDAPDATVQLDVECTDPITMVAAVRNLGAALLPDGVEVGFYVVEGGGERLLGTETTGSPLFPGQAEEVAFTAPGDVTPEDTFRARILVDEAMPVFRECRDDNNTSADVMPRCVF